MSDVDPGVPAPGRRRSPITLLRRRWRKLLARGIRRVGGDGTLDRIQGRQRPTTTSRLGSLGDPAAIYDPVAAGEPLPEGFRQIHPRDRILPIYEPRIVPASRVSWPDDYLVIGVEMGAGARAYPVRLLDKREMVLDELADVPVVVSWCSVCGTGMVHRRVVDGTPIVLGNQGALFGNAMTWWDHDTGSVWTQPTAICLVGPRKGARLELVSSTMTTWGSWRTRHPSTDVLRAPTKAQTLELSDLAIVASLKGDVMGFAINDLRAVAVANERLGVEPIAAVIDPTDLNAWNVFSRRLDDRTVTLEADGGTIVDRETGSTWDVDSGVARSGDLEGERLARVPAATAKPEEFATHWPEGTMWRRSRGTAGDAASG